MHRTTQHPHLLRFLCISRRGRRLHGRQCPPLCLWCAWFGSHSCTPNGSKSGARGCHAALAALGHRQRPSLIDRPIFSSTCQIAVGQGPTARGLPPHARELPSPGALHSLHHPPPRPPAPERPCRRPALFGGPAPLLHQLRVCSSVPQVTSLQDPPPPPLAMALARATAPRSAVSTTARRASRPARSTRRAAPVASSAQDKANELLDTVSEAWDKTEDKARADETTWGTEAQHSPPRRRDLRPRGYALPAARFYPHDREGVLYLCRPRRWWGSCAPKCHKTGSRDRTGVGSRGNVLSARLVGMMPPPKDGKRGTRRRNSPAAALWVHPRGCRPPPHPISPLISH